MPKKFVPQLGEFAELTPFSAIREGVYKITCGSPLPFKEYFPLSLGHPRLVAVPVEFDNVSIHRVISGELAAGRDHDDCQTEHREACQHS